MRKHLDRLAAEGNRRDTATPVRGHNDQIALSRRSGIDDRLIDVLMLDVSVSQSIPADLAAAATVSSTFSA